MSLGKAVKIARIEKGWKQVDLQEATGLSQKYLSEIENDHVDPRLSIAKRLADALGITVDALCVSETPELSA